MLGGPEVPVDMKQLIFPLHKVGSMVQVVDKHSLQGENHGKKYWYDATVTAVILEAKLMFPTTSWYQQTQTRRRHRK